MIEFKTFENYIEENLAPSKSFKLHCIKAILNGETIGYIKLTHLPREEWLNEPYWYLQMKNIIFTPSDVNLRSKEDLYQLDMKTFPHDVYSMALKYMGWNDANRELEKVRAMSKEDAVNYMAAVVIPQYMKRIQSDFDQTIEYHTIAMYTDFIRVEESHRGTGLAEQLYLKAVEFARSKGWRYRFSINQSDAAKAVMQRFIDKGMVTTEKHTFWGHKYTFNFLDRV